MRYNRFIPVAILTVGMLFALLTEPVLAQFETPRPSPKATVSQVIGVTQVELTYSRPGVKGRTIWGGLVPFDKVWRTGANEATTISFSTDVTVNGHALPGGKYSLATIPGKDHWVVIFNKNADLWGAFGYKEEEDALRIQTTPMPADFLERMMFYFTSLADDSATVVLHWERLQVPFTIKVNTDSLVMASANKAINWQTPYRAADYALQHDLDLARAHKWLEISQSIETNYYNTNLQARLLHKEGNKKQAIQTMEKAIQMTATMNEPPFNLEQMKSLLDEWKK